MLNVRIFDLKAYPLTGIIPIINYTNNNHKFKSQWFGIYIFYMKNSDISVLTLDYNSNLINTYDLNILLTRQ